MEDSYVSLSYIYLLSTPFFLLAFQRMFRKENNYTRSIPGEVQKVKEKGILYLKKVLKAEQDLPMQYVSKIYGMKIYGWGEMAIF